MTTATRPDETESGDPSWLAQPDQEWGTPYRRRTFEPPITPGPGRWVKAGACVGATGDVLAAYIAEEPTAADDLALARCSRCPVASECAGYARESRIVCGIWGGRRRTDSDGYRRPNKR